LTTARPVKRRLEREDILLWIFVVTPVLAWIAAQQLSYLAASSICATGHRWVLYVVMGSSLAATVLAGTASFTKWKALASRRSGGRSVAYRQFMALGGVFLGGLCAVAIFALLIPATLHRLCD
jgi:hypothetical protein